MHAAKVRRARAAVITLDDPAAAAAALRVIRRDLPDLPVILRARDAQNMDELLRRGASSVMPETIESSLLLGGMVLRTLGETDAQIDEIVGQLRNSTYQGRGSDVR
jgi:CPA2 family monovalent cation:H+ antiporter-2